MKTCSCSVLQQNLTQKGSSNGVVHRPTPQQASSSQFSKDLHGILVVCQRHVQGLADKIGSFNTEGKLPLEKKKVG